MTLRGPLHLGIAVGAVALALLLRLALDPWLGNSQPVIVLYAAIAFVLWSSGWRFAVVAAAVGYAASYVLFIEPRGVHAMGAPSMMLGLGLYTFSCAVVIGLGEALRRAQDRAETAHAALRREMAERRRTEDALRASEARFRAFMDNSPANAFVKDGAGCYLYMNQPMQDHFGADRAQWYGKTDADLLGEANAARLRDNDRVVLESGRTVEFEETLDGGPRGHRTFLAFKFPIVARDGTRLVGGMAFDITARRATELALRRRSEEFQTVLERMPSPIFVAHDPRCEHVTGNLAAQSLFGVAPADAELAPPREEHATSAAIPPVHLYDSTGRELAHEDRPMQRAAATGQPTPPDEIEIRFDDGRRAWLFGSAAPLFDAPGVVRGALALYVDVTELRRAEQHMHADLDAMTRLHDLATLYATDRGDPAAPLTAMLDAAIATLGAQRGTLRLIDPDTGKVELLAQRGFDPDFLRFFATVCLDGDSPCGLARQTQRRVIVDDLRRDTPGVNPSVRALLLDAGVHAVQSTPLVTGAGKLVGLIATHFDRPHRPDAGALRLMDLLARQAADHLERRNAKEELLRLNAELRRMDQRKDEFLATLAHELRNPLAPIANTVQILKRRPLPDDLAESRDVIERQATHMARLLDDLLDVSRISRGRVTLRRARVALADVLASATETSRPLIEAGGHRLEIALPDAPVYLDADPVRLAQVFSNLLNNAARYSDPGCLIHVTVDNDDDSVTIRVRDTGHGIAPDTLPQIFEMFAQGERKDALAPAGLGVGLSLARALVALHDGTIEAASDGPDRGSEFAVRLPRVRDADADAPVEDSAALAPPPPKRRLLIADDVRDSADSLAMLLRMMGHDVQTAADGEAAIAAAECFRPEVVLLDIGMPNGNGYDVCRHIRAQPWGRDMCIVAVTGWSQHDDRRRAEGAGFDHHFAKPVDLAALTRVLAPAEAPVPSPH